MTDDEIEELTIAAGPHRWRVLRAGAGPVALCLHGAGGSADSFRPLIPFLSSDVTIVAPDLPGHGRTRLGGTGRSGLVAMTEDVALLVAAFELEPEILIGHSAGAAIALNLDDRLSPRGQVLINAALSEFDGLAGWVFPALAKGLSITPFAADFLSRNLRRQGKLEGLLASTGSEVTRDILTRYRLLAASREHVDGTLKMMAAWDLKPLLRKIPQVQTPTLLIAGDRDGTVPVSVSKKAKQSLKHSKLIVHEGGHLLHEEDPEIVAQDIRAFINSLDKDAQSSSD
ncbi:alpha/beta fold hydrolase BchO [Silicimonas sp. MF1-12-2]|uniref:alpha/beta fold hydrolase BchO n=1 Tax=Silicimonas sp. MF1-12-2 TaxID=3384793 RepID=UPI0039B3BDCF